jgi:hypothetical protein
MKTAAPFDSTFERIPEPLFKWQYQDSNVNAAYVAWGLQYQFSLASLDDYLQEDDWEKSEAAKEIRAVHILRRAHALQAFKTGNTDLAFAWINFLFAAMRASKRQEFLLPLSRTGKKFSVGRKVGTVGPVRAAIRRYLKRSPTARTAEIWSSLESKPPRGWEFFDNRFGRYIETNGPESTSYRRFGNIVSEERKLLAQQ